ncbi:MAG: hypothetical protein JW794_08720 [Candidatus Cloacimonetes bacterium]|nr:hypothetical protein [Candidatus Cloacimonadota bacterium]
MKKIIPIILVMTLIVCSVLNASQNKRYAIKSAHIVYELSGNISGQKEVWFDDYGMKYYEEENTTTTIKMFGITSEEKEHTIVIHDGQTLYDIDMITKTGYKGTMPDMSEFKDMAENMSEAEQKKLKDDMMDQLGGKELGTEMFLGKKCEVMEVMGVKSWFYNVIMLKSESNMMGVVSNETATTFKENIAVPASRFDPPAGITYEDMPSFGGMFSDEEDEDEYYEDEEYGDIPVPITFDEFKSGISGISSSGYTQTMVMQEEGEYMAMYMSSMGSMIMVMGSGYTSEDMDEGFESFTHKGKTMKYGTIAEGGNSISMLMVLYPYNKLMISINSMTGLSKDELIKIAEKLTF